MPESIVKDVGAVGYERRTGLGMRRVEGKGASYRSELLYRNFGFLELFYVAPKKIVHLSISSGNHSSRNKKH